VRILKYWSDVDLLRQTPQNSGYWRGVRFIIDEPGEADYVVLHGHAKGGERVTCPRGAVWLVMGEAPTEWCARWHIVPEWIDRVFMTDQGWADRSRKHILSPPGLPWSVGRDYDFLTTFAPPKKVAPLSWITSNAEGISGHRYRMRYLRRVEGMNELHIFGRGFNPIHDKWDKLVPYRYSIAFENFSNSHYWTEKVMDCFLAWTMPIYYGCTELERFFPADSFVRLDPEAPDPEAELRRIIRSDLWERNMEAIEEARRRVLDDYNLFEMIVAEIERTRSASPHPALARTITLKDHTKWPLDRLRRLRRRLVSVAKGIVRTGDTTQG
jgi:hypothetical protein